MSDMAVVFESDNWHWVEEVMGALEERGLHPELKDDAGAAYYRMKDKNPGVVGLPSGRMKVSVVVPEEEEQAARSFLQERDQPSRGHVVGLSGGLGRALVLSLLAAAVAGVAMAYSAGGSEDRLACLGLALIFVLPVCYCLTANMFLVHKLWAQISALVFAVTAIVYGIHHMDQGNIWTSCCLQGLPIVGVFVIWIRTRQRNRQKEGGDEMR